MVRISNHKLLEELEKNSRIPYSKLARKFGVTETAIRKRIRKLEREGVIKKYTLVLDPKKLGFQTVTLIGIDTGPESFLKVLRKLEESDKVKSLWTSSGDHMILAECWFKDTKELSAFIDRLEKMHGVTKVCPAIIIEKIK
ncbi:MAG: Lrp/AsnC family transcriptional regulator [Candidatus Micrarchaeota archaeon]|nr:Lrp/AsnC family transcriptional regulator [Candidatus Micrarchaeota archaeon]